MEIKISNLKELVEEFPEIKRGCVIDTNVLFAGSYPSDTYNDWAEEVFNILDHLCIPSFTNLNVRSEFLELQRRVLVAEGLVDFYDDLSGALDGKIYDRLKLLKRRANEARSKGRAFKLNDSDIKEFMDLFGHEPNRDGVSRWTEFCRSYFAPYITTIWEDVVQELRINFLGTQEIATREFFQKHPSWENMITILGESAVGSADAMILNLFKESTLPLLITADRAVKNTLLNSSFKGKFVLSP